MGEVLAFLWSLVVATGLTVLLVFGVLVISAFVLMIKAIAELIRS